MHLATACGAESAARAAAAAAGLPGTAVAADFRAAERERRQHAGHLGALREEAERAETEDATAAAARQRAVDRAAEIEAAERALAELRSRQEDLIARRDAARLAAERLPLVRADADRQRTAAADAAQLADDCAGVRDLREQRESAREYANDLREIAQRIREERFDGMIAELVARLTDDSPCPVCGSLDHPEPSEIQARRVTHHEEEQAYAEAEAAKDAVNKLDSELAIVGARVGDLIGRLMAADVTDPVLREDAALAEALAVAVPSAILPSATLPSATCPARPCPARRLSRRAARRRCPGRARAGPWPRRSAGCRARTRWPGCTTWPPPSPPPAPREKRKPSAWTPKPGGSAGTRAI